MWKHLIRKCNWGLLLLGGLVGAMPPGNDINEKPDERIPAPIAWDIEEVVIAEL